MVISYKIMVLMVGYSHPTCFYSRGAFILGTTLISKRNWP